MHYKTCCLCVVAFAILLPSAVARHTKDVQKIPFKLYRNHLVVVTGTLGHLRNRNLLIDTGASPTVIDEALAFELGLKPTGRPPGGMAIIGGIAQTYYAILDNLDFGPIHRESMSVSVANLSLLQADAKLRIDAIIGLDAIRPNSFQIDYDARKITFGNIRMPGVAAVMKQSGPFVIVETEVNGTALDVLVDTGTSELVFFRNALPDRVAAQRTGKNVQLSNIAGDLTAAQVYVSNFRVGNSDLNGRTALLASAPDGCEFQGIWGISASDIHRVAFDFQHELVGFELVHPLPDVMPAHPSCLSFGGGDCRHALLPPNVRQ